MSIRQTGYGLFLVTITTPRGTFEGCGLSVEEASYRARLKAAKG